MIRAALLVIFLGVAFSLAAKFDQKLQIDIADYNKALADNKCKCCAQAKEFSDYKWVGIDNLNRGEL